ncbi:hypothetical protein PoB_003293500 [Plakobranchus ocellatus]|uniref:Uncharacterized protein n=1 Tax=Plakobranchus ocellatus TaxID=259542 RepID=A0AAV4AE49_9GAST|nr:hypothetical protein PoB_003293500 [Plakobranchus ocellatus]
MFRFWLRNNRGVERKTQRVKTRSLDHDSRTSAGAPPFQLSDLTPMPLARNGTKLMSPPSLCLHSIEAHFLSANTLARGVGKKQQTVVFTWVLSLGTIVARYLKFKVFGQYEEKDD